MKLIEYCLKTKIKWLLYLALTMLLVILQGLGEDVISLFRYEITMVQTGEWWRLLTGHFIHLSWSHLIFNLTGLWFLILLFYQIVNPVLLFTSVLLLSLGTSLSLMFFSPDVVWYLGLSGMLHGLYLMGAIAGYRNRPWPSIILLVAILVKLLWEQLYADAHAMELTIGGKVIYDAHLYGAITGLGLITVFIVISSLCSGDKKSFWIIRCK